MYATKATECGVQQAEMLCVVQAGLRIQQPDTGSWGSLGVVGYPCSALVVLMHAYAASGQQFCAGNRTRPFEGQWLDSCWTIHSDI